MQVHQKANLRQINHSQVHHSQSKSRFRASVNWERVDWNLTDVEIARRHHVSTQRVGVKRKALGLPASRGRHRNLLRVYEAVQGYPDMLPSTLARRSGLPAKQIQYVRSKLGFAGNLDRAKYPFGQMNWELPNVDLARIWAIPAGKVGKMRRQRKRRSARWHRRWGNLPSDAAYHHALDKERAKARQWKQQQE